MEEHAAEMTQILQRARAWNLKRPGGTEGA